MDGGDKCGGFARIPNAVLDSDLKPDVKLVLCGLIRCAYGNKTTTTISQLGLSKRLRMDRKKIRSALVQLQTLRVIERVGGGRRGESYYRLHLDGFPKKVGTISQGTWEPSPTNNTDVTDNSNKTARKRDVISETKGAVAADTFLNGIGTAEGCSEQDNDMGTIPQVREKRKSGSCVVVDGPLAGMTAEEIRRRCLCPNGKSFYDNDCYDDAWLTASNARKYAGGEDFNPGSLQDIIDRCGEAAVWFHAKWFLRRLSAGKTPIPKPAPYFLKCVAEDYPISPLWANMSVQKHWSEMSPDELLNVAFG